MEFSNQDLFQLVQLTLSRIDTLLTAMAVIAAVFGIIVAFIVGFFTIRQMNVDREIQKYKDEIKDQKDKIKEQTNKIQEELSETSKLAAEAKSKIKEELKIPLSKRTKEDLSKLQKEVERLKEAVDIKRGEIKFDNTFSISPFNNITASVFGDIVCKKCGKSYNKKISPYFSPLSAINFSYLDESNKCPYCGNIN